MFGSCRRAVGWFAKPGETGFREIGFERNDKKVQWIDMMNEL